MRSLSLSLALGCALFVHADPCDNITPISCGVVTTAATNGPGDPGYPNGLGNSSWRAFSGTGGTEMVFRFVVPADGTYQLNSIDGNFNDYFEFYWKEEDLGCGPLDWSFIRYTDSDQVPLGALNWSEGDSILILVNGESTTNSWITFRINCLAPICDTEPLLCGSIVTFNSFGYGDPGYMNGFGNSAWYGFAGQGGQEHIYRFGVPADGTYQLNVGTVTGTSAAEFFWKNDTLGCGPSDWNYIVHTNLDDFPIVGLHWSAGDTVLILLNREGRDEPEAITFSLVCLPPVCSTIIPLQCGQSATFTTYGYGDPDYPNGFDHPGWHGYNGQGGMEQLYRFGVPADGDYRVTMVDATDFRGSEFFWKNDTLDCGPTDWNFIGFTDQDGYVFPDVTWSAGDTILLLVNNEVRDVASTTFLIDCLGLGLSATQMDVPTLRLYPQPSEGTFTLEGWSGVAQGRILNAWGEEVQRFWGTAPLMLQTAAPPGWYVVEMRSAEGSERSRLLITR